MAAKCQAIHEMQMRKKTAFKMRRASHRSCQQAGAFNADWLQNRVWKIWQDFFEGKARTKM